VPFHFEEVVMRLASTRIIAVTALLGSTACVERVGVGSDALGGNTTTSAANGGGVGDGQSACFSGALDSIGSPPDVGSIKVTLGGTVDGTSVCTSFVQVGGFGGIGEPGAAPASLGQTARPGNQGAILLANTLPPGWMCAAACGVGTPCCDSDCHNGVCGGAMNTANLFQLPTTGEWFCAGSAVSHSSPSTLVPFLSNLTFDLSNLAKLGSCPGTPVAGTVTMCLDDPPTMGRCSGMGASISSTLAGATFAWQEKYWGGSVSEMDGTFDADLGGPVPIVDGSDTFAVMAWSPQPGGGTVSGGILVIGPGNPDAGAVYCIGGGTVSYPAGPFEFTLTGLSRLGTCADNPISGSVKVMTME
jgi:hypothetical protein